MDKNPTDLDENPQDEANGLVAPTDYTDGANNQERGRGAKGRARGRGKGKGRGKHF